MSRYFLGVDVGSSKTHALIADEQGMVCGFGEAGAGNHETVGYEGLIAALQQATGQALSRANLSSDDIAGAGFGVSGYDWPSERAATRQVIDTLGLHAPIEWVNDTLIGLIAGASDGWGVAIVSGTGCNCWGRDRQHRTAHMTGHGSRMGEGAGATELIREATRHVARHWSRRGPATQLTRAFIDITGARDIDDLLEGLCQGGYGIDASSARVVFEVAAQGDEVARDLIQWAGHELGSLASGIIRQLGFETQAIEVVMVGSLFDGGARLIDPMQATIRAVAPAARFVRLTTPPVVGGVLLGMEQAGHNLTASRANLIASTEKFLTKRRVV
jgi:N-acetylglucosamine kinase-like BadF-type ATPase